MKGKNLNHLFSTINADLARLSDWFKANKLVLNANKTKYVLFTHAGKNMQEKLSKKLQLLSIRTKLQGLNIPSLLSRFEGEVKSYRVFKDNDGYFLFPVRHFSSLNHLFEHYSQNMMVPGDNYIGPVLRAPVIEN